MGDRSASGDSGAPPASRLSRLRGLVGTMINPTSRAMRLIPRPAGAGGFQVEGLTFKNDNALL